MSYLADDRLEKNVGEYTESILWFYLILRQDQYKRNTCPHLLDN